MMVGAAEDVGKTSDYAFAKTSMDKAKLAGFDSIRITQTWTKDQTKLGAADAIILDNAVNAAQFTGLRVVLSLYPFGSSVTPLTDDQRADFASFAADIANRYPVVHDFIVGNEPNLNRFWLPQFNAGRHRRRRARVRAAAGRGLRRAEGRPPPRRRSIGGALAPRGVDKPNTGRDTHSPSAFITDLGAAYRASGRQLPIMDAFAFHPYPETSSTAPNVAHPNGTSTRSRGLLEARRTARHRVRRNGAAWLCSADPLRRVRDRDADPARPRRRSTWLRSPRPRSPSMRRRRRSTTSRRCR